MDTTDEPRLRWCVRDLVALSAMPATWIGRSPAMIAESLCDLVATTVHTDAVCVQLRDVRAGNDGTAALSTDIVVSRSIPDLRLRQDATALRLASFAIGVNGELGRFIVGSQRPQFPEELESLLLQVTANHVAIALRHAALLHERDELLARSAAAQAEAEKASRSKSEFLAMMSHELRTPLNAIGGYAELLELGIHGPLTDAQRKDVGRIRHSGQYLLSLINNILTFMKLGSGQIRYEIESVELGEVLQSIDQLIRPQMDAKRLHLDYTGAGAGVRVLADRDKLHQIILNLLSNASKFTDPGGDVHLECTADEWTVTITVRDTGCGIPADQLQRVFEPFVQVHRSTGGTGLGLAISRDFARAMGGDMVLTSEVGRGSTFTVPLPRG